MRVGLVIYGAMDSISGGYLYNRQLVAYLERQGDQVEIFSLPQRSYGQQLSANFSSVWLRRIQAAQLDILLQDAMVHPSWFLLNRKLQCVCKLPVITLIHLLSSFSQHPRYTQGWFRAVEQHYLQTVTGLIVNSQTTLTQLKTLMPAPLPPYCVAVPAADHLDAPQPELAVLQQRAQQAGPLQLLFVGNVIERKGLHVLLRALQQLPPADFRLMVVGRLDMEPAYVRRLQQLIVAADLQAVVRILGPRQGQELTALYQQHQLMVLPSAYESYGIVYVEAQQFGLPVLGTTAGAAQEIIRPGENGYLITPEDHQQLAEVLQQLQRDRELLWRLSQQALRAYQQHPVWDDSCARIRDFLAACLAPPTTAVSNNA